MNDDDYVQVQSEHAASPSLASNSAESAKSVRTTLAEGTLRSDTMFCVYGPHYDLLARYQHENLKGSCDLTDIHPVSFYNGTWEMPVKNGQGNCTLSGRSEAALFDEGRKVLVREDPEDQASLHELSSEDPSVKECTREEKRPLLGLITVGVWLIDDGPTGHSRIQDDGVYTGTQGYSFPPIP